MAISSDDEYDVSSTPDSADIVIRAPNVQVNHIREELDGEFMRAVEAELHARGDFVVAASVQNTN
ncbi:hypothetical protein CVT26_008577 [Gymnopilus dilepis]|uniref:Uncharacterized protein n=1 Tax=Gymnopilus dilepis TaxID=231916 RepID=A0A409XXP8_9AGAR|nr:hypothetical protein CVT26_008577 [Gymnopilus dilepis]